MKRYVKIFLLHAEHVFQNRDRIFVWFLISLFGPLVMILFWKGATNTRPVIVGWNYQALFSYYLLEIVISASLLSHIDEDVAYTDISKGELVKYLLKPIQYYLFKFYEEIVYRIFEGILGIVAVVGIIFLTGKSIVTHFDLLTFPLILVMIAMAFLLSFTFNMILGLLALWIVNISGFRQMVEVVTIIFAGLAVPLIFLPSWLEVLAKILPFSYMVYYPAIGFMGIMGRAEVLQVIGVQIIWLGILGVGYRAIWNRGIRSFTAVGQ